MNWSSFSGANHGFQIVALTKATNGSAYNDESKDFSAVSYFCFSETQIEKLATLGGVPEAVKGERVRMLNAWKGAMAVVGGNETTTQQPLLPRAKKLLGANESLNCVAWSIDPQTYCPLILVAGEQAIIYAWDPTSNRMKGIMRGHGGPIYEIVVHPINPFVFASASRDRSVRVYDLAMQASSTLPEAVWPATASRLASLPEGAPGLSNFASGEAAGMIGGPLGSQVPASAGGEGKGLGKCFLVLRGQSKSSGGHVATVLGVTFHPNGPFIATAGVDHCVKIWRTPEITAPAARRVLKITDKPVFSSRRVHESYVTSIHWLSPEVLVSKSSGANGTIVMWKWLELQRFSPKQVHAFVRCLPSDYNDNVSFTILAKSPVATFGEDNTRLALCPPSPLGHSGAWIGLPSSRGKLLLWEVASIPPQARLRAPKKPSWADEAKLLQLRPGERPKGDTSQPPRREARTSSKQKGKQKQLSPSPEPDECERAGSGSGGGTSSEEQLAPWTPSALLSLEDVVDDLPNEFRRQLVQGVKMHSVAFSPHGLEYVVGVGEGQTIALWKRS
ncbi:hypothetical protein FRB90_000375 [Tulasnella sp. 427]|nr:hypothetical protein FRB90_000375 [Tulasnella sp. 427]